jgi:hypothetical protein
MAETGSKIPILKSQFNDSRTYLRTCLKGQCCDQFFLDFDHFFSSKTMFWIILCMNRFILNNKCQLLSPFLCQEFCKIKTSVPSLVHSLKSVICTHDSQKTSVLKVKINLCTYIMSKKDFNSSLICLVLIIIALILECREKSRISQFFLTPICSEVFRFFRFYEKLFLFIFNFFHGCGFFPPILIFPT